MSRINLTPVKRSIITFAIATTVALGLTGCGVDQAAHTATQVAPVPGFSATYVQGGTYSVSVRNAYLVYPGPGGYKAGDDATVKIWLFNDTQNEVTVLLRSDAGTLVPSEPIKIPSAGMVAHEMKLTDLREAILPGPSVPVRVEFVGIHEFLTQLSIAPPDAPQPRTPLELEEEAGEGH